MPDSVLPNRQTPWMRAAEAAGQDALAIDLPIERLLRPREVPEAFLPLLARHLSVDLWDATWSPDKMREVLAEWYRLKCLVGTPEGMRRYVEIAGGKVVKQLWPPQGAFPGSGITPAERQAWLDLQPQLRIYPYSPPIIVDRGIFLGPRGGFFVRKGSAFISNHRPAERVRRIAKLYDPRDGSLVDLTVREHKLVTFTGTAVDFEEIVLPASPRRGFFVGRGKFLRRGTFVGSDDLPQRTYRLRIDRPYEYSRGQPQDRTYAPGLEPISLYPDHVYEVGERRPGQFFVGRGQFLRRGTMVLRSTAWQRVYERIYLHDPDRMIDIKRGRVFANRSFRPGFAARTAEVTIEVTKPAPERGFFVGRFLRRLFAHSADNSRTEAVLDAVMLAKGIGDEVRVRLTTYRTATFNDLATTPDSFRFGDPIRDF